MTSPLPITSAPLHAARLRLHCPKTGGWAYGSSREVELREQGRVIAVRSGWFALFSDVELFPTHWKPCDPPPPVEASDDTSGEGA